MPDRGQFCRRDGRLELAVGQVEPAAEVDLVAAAAGDHVQGDAAGLHGDVRAAGGDVHLLERVEVPVDGGGADGRRVGDDDAVNGPDVVAAAARIALGDVAGLLAGFRAADVLAVHDDRRRHLHDVPGVAGGRQGLQDLLRDVLADRGLLGVDRRRDGDDRHFLFHLALFKGQVDQRLLTEDDDDARLFLLLEPLQLGRQSVGVAR